MTAALSDVIAERRRQVGVEGFKLLRDDAYVSGELSVAAACYALSASGWDPNAVQGLWPKSWSVTWWKPTTPRRDLVKATALMLAEIERRDRAEARKTKPSSLGDSQ